MLVSARHAASTAAHYSAHALYFARFLICFGLAPFLLAPTQPIILLYVAFLARTCTYRTVKNYLQGLRDFFLSHLGHNPLQHMVQLQWALQGLRRLKGDLQHRKRPITPAMLLSFFQVLQFDSSYSVAVFTAMLFAFFAFMRKSNVTVASARQPAAGHHLRRGDVRVDTTNHCLWLTIRSSKTIQFQERVFEVPIVGFPGHPLDPVFWWQLLCSLAPAPASAPAFSYLSPSGHLVPLFHSQLIGATKSLSARLGFDPATVSGHSFRRGGASFAFLSGAPPELIKFQGDWRSSAYLVYLCLSPSQKCLTNHLMWRRISSRGLGSELH